MHIGEAEITTLTAETEAFMVDPKLMQNSSMKVVDVDLILSGVIAELIGRTISQTRLPTVLALSTLLGLCLPAR